MLGIVICQIIAKTYPTRGVDIEAQYNAYHIAHVPVDELKSATKEEKVWGCGNICILFFDEISPAYTYGMKHTYLRHSTIYFVIKIGKVKMKILALRPDL